MLCHWVSGSWHFEGVSLAFLNLDKNRTIFVCFLLGNSPVSEFYVPMFRNTLSVPSRCRWIGVEHLSAYEDGTDRVF